MKKTVLLLENIDNDALVNLMEQMDVVVGYDKAHLRDFTQYERIHAIVTRGKGQVDKTLMQACPHLEVIARCGVGLDNIDVPAATALGVKVLNTPSANAATVAEHTLSLMLTALRGLYLSIEQVKQGNWDYRNTYAGDELRGKTLGIVGLGNIGKRVAHLATAFGMHVCYWSRTQQKDVKYPYHPFETLLRQSDVVSLHLPLTIGSPPLIDAAQLALMKPTAYLINTARGGLINHVALLKALNKGQLGGFAADVLPELSPSLSKAFRQKSTVVITPHISSLTVTTYRQMCLLTVDNVLATLQGAVVDPKFIFNDKDLNAGSL